MNNSKKESKKKSAFPPKKRNDEVSKEEWIRLNQELFGEDNSEYEWEEEGDETEELNFDR